MEILKVSSKSNPNSVAGAMAGVVRQAGAVEVQVVGAGALNQAIKAVAIARNYVASAGLDLVCSPTFADISIDGEDRTGCADQVAAARAAGRRQAFQGEDEAAGRDELRELGPGRRHLGARGLPASTRAAPGGRWNISSMRSVTTKPPTMLMIL